MYFLISSSKKQKKLQSLSIAEKSLTQNRRDQFTTYKYFNLLKKKKNQTFSPDGPAGPIGPTGPGNPYKHKRNTSVVLRNGWEIWNMGIL